MDNSTSSTISITSTSMNIYNTTNTSIAATNTTEANASTTTATLVFQWKTDFGVIDRSLKNFKYIKSSF